MAQLPKCCGCEYYLLKRDTGTIDDLPIAKGR